ncbi:MAG: sigma-70 family RNA polymerase sigma factor [Christensenellaceae bacterium]|nr:sigma-70 family RNA polymerase sigma factor [Christensenellaceae bacterium]
MDKSKDKNLDPDFLIRKHNPLIKSIVRRYVGRGVEYDDLYQLGCLGFVKAIKKYDKKYNVKFTTYAVPLIAGEIKRFLRDDGCIKVSRSVKSLYVKIKKYLAENNTPNPTVDNLASHFNVDPEDIIYAMEASHLPLSLFDKNENDDGEDGISLAEKISANDDKAYIDKIMISNCLKKLNPTEQKIILLRYYRNQTQSEVAAALNLSQVQVSRMEQKVLAEIKAYFTADVI